MKKTAFLKIFFLLTLLTSSFLFAEDSKLTTLIKNKKTEQLKLLIKTTITIDNLSLLPKKAKDNDLMIFKNDEDRKSIYEYFNNRWIKKTSKFLNDILNEENTNYVHSVNSKEFNPFTEEVKEKSNSKKLSKFKVFVKFLDSKFNETAVNNTIKLFSENNLIQRDQIINIQIIPSSKTKCRIIFTYKQ